MANKNGGAMLAREEALRRWREATSPLRQGAIDAAVGAYFDALAKTECSVPADFQAAARAAEASLTKRVLTQEWIAALGGASLQESDAEAALELSFNAVRPQLRLPAPALVSELSPLRIGIAALVGAIGGMMVLAPLARIVLGMKDVGVFVGAPGGAFLLVQAVWYSARSKWLRRGLVLAFGVAAIGEVWAILTGGGILRRVWSGLGGRGSGLKRILLYLAVIFFVVVAKPRSRFDRQEHERLIRSAFDQWLDAAIPTLGLLVQATNGERKALDFHLWDLPQKVLEMRRVPPDNLPAAVEELVQFLKNSGVDVDERKTFCWETRDRERYEVFGNVEPGDQVAVEREPVVFQGDVRRKGLVRKVREGA